MYNIQNTIIFAGDQSSKAPLIIGIVAGIVLIGAIILTIVINKKNKE